MIGRWRVRSLVVPEEIRDAITDQIASSHPHEAGGFLACERRARRLRAVDHCGLANEADRPRRRFVSTDVDAVPDRPRVFYHSHTSAATPSGLTGIDRKHIPYDLSLVIFAPHGQPYSYRLFRRSLFNWREIPVEAPADESGGRPTRLPRLI